jgi:hypothetical protein
MEDVWGNRIQFADQNKVELYGIEIKRILSAVSFFMSDDPQGWIGNCWVSDMTSMGDFGLDEEEVVEVGESLGSLVGKDEILWEIAKRLHEKLN